MQARATPLQLAQLLLIDCERLDGYRVAVETRPPRKAVLGARAAVPGVTGNDVREAATACM